MHATITRANSIRITIERDLITRSGLERHLYAYIVFLFRHPDDLLEQWRAGGCGKVAHIIGQPIARVVGMIHLLAFGIIPGVKMEGYSPVEVRGGFQAALNRLQRIVGVGIKDRTIIQPAQLRTVQLWIASSDMMRQGGPTAEHLRELLSIFPDGQF